MLSREQVEHVALLARLELKEEEIEMYRQQLGKILEYIEKLNELDTTDVPPTAHVLPVKNVYREDAVREHMATEKALANAPDREENYFRVPRIL